MLTQKQIKDELQRRLESYIQKCKGDSDDASVNRSKYFRYKRIVEDIGQFIEDTED